MRVWKTRNFRHFAGRKQPSDSDQTTVEYWIEKYYNIIFFLRVKPRCAHCARVHVIHHWHSHSKKINHKKMVIKYNCRLYGILFLYFCRFTWKSKHQSAYSCSSFRFTNIHQPAHISTYTIIYSLPIFAFSSFMWTVVWLLCICIIRRSGYTELLPECSGRLTVFGLLRHINICIV